VSGPSPEQVVGLVGARRVGLPACWVVGEIEIRDLPDCPRELEIRFELLLELGERPLSVEAVAEQLHVLHGRLGREHPCERHAGDPGPGEIAEVVGHARVVDDLGYPLGVRSLRGVEDLREGRLHGAALRVDQAVGEDDGVASLLLEGDQRPDDQRVRLSLVEGEQLIGDATIARASRLRAVVGLVVGVGAVVACVNVRASERVQQVRNVEHAVEVTVLLGCEERRRARPTRRLITGLEHEVALRRAGIVRPVPVESFQRELEVAVADVERHRHPRAQVHQVDRVVGEVVVVAAVTGDHVREVERRALWRALSPEIERHRDRREGAPTLQTVEPFARVALDRRRGHVARVDTKPCSARGIGPGRRVVGQRDVRQRLVREIEPNGRPRTCWRATEIERRLAVASNEEEEDEARPAEEGSHGRSVVRRGDERCPPQATRGAWQPDGLRQ
jgi:hypothetical protein